MDNMESMIQEVDGVEGVVEVDRERDGVGVGVERLPSPQGEDPPPLCSECRAIFDNWYERYDWKEARPEHLHHDIVGLQDSSQNGCPICGLFLSGLSAADVQKLLQDHAHKRGVVTVRHDALGAGGFFTVTLYFITEDHWSAPVLETKLDAFVSRK
jgi:hypothetical protein